MQQKHLISLKDYSREEIEEIFDLEYYLKNIEYIFGRVFGKKV